MCLKRGNEPVYMDWRWFDTFGVYQEWKKAGRPDDFPGVSASFEPGQKV